MRDARGRSGRQSTADTLTEWPRCCPLLSGSRTDRRTVAGRGTWCLLAIVTVRRLDARPSSSASRPVAVERLPTVRATHVLPAGVAGEVIGRRRRRGGLVGGGDAATRRISWRVDPARGTGDGERIGSGSRRWSPRTTALCWTRLTTERRRTGPHTAQAHGGGVWQTARSSRRWSLSLRGSDSRQWPVDVTQWSVVSGQILCRLLVDRCWPVVRSLVRSLRSRQTVTTGQIAPVTSSPQYLTRWRRD